MEIEITIVPQRCLGCPYCEEIMPDIFRVKERVTLVNPTEGVYKTRVPISSLDRVIKAVTNCPAKGISYRILRV